MMQRMVSLFGTWLNLVLKKTRHGIEALLEYVLEASSNKETVDAMFVCRVLALQELQNLTQYVPSLPTKPRCSRRSDHLLVLSQMPLIVAQRSYYMLLTSNIPLPCHAHDGTSGISYPTC